MAYESKIIIAELCEMENYKCSLEIARINLSRAGEGFTDIFTNTLDWEICGDGFEMNSTKEFDMTEDSYGDICRYTDLQTVIDYMEKSEAYEHYRRFGVALAMLKAFQNEKWDYPLIVIHYGY